MGLLKCARITLRNRSIKENNLIINVKIMALQGVSTWKFEARLAVTLAKRPDVVEHTYGLMGKTIRVIDEDTMLLSWIIAQVC